MRGEDRKAATTAWKERKQEAGVFAVRCTATGDIWVGASQTLDKAQNRLWFMLRQQGSPHRALQAVWSAQGEAAFAFEALERLEEVEGETAYGLRSRLEERRAHWVNRLSAVSLS